MSFASSGTAATGASGPSAPAGVGPPLAYPIARPIADLDLGMQDIWGGRSPRRAHGAGGSATAPLGRYARRRLGIDAITKAYVGGVSNIGQVKQGHRTYEAAALAGSAAESAPRNSHAQSPTRSDLVDLVTVPLFGAQPL